MTQNDEDLARGASRTRSSKNSTATSELAPTPQSSAATDLRGGRPALLPRRLPWADALIRAAGSPIPDYGTPAWSALPDNSPAKVAATVIAAECFRQQTDPAWIAWRLRTELAAGQALDEEPARWTPEIVAQVHAQANRGRHSQICDRRGEPERAERARQHERRLGLVPVA